MIRRVLAKLLISLFSRLSQARHLPLLLASFERHNSGAGSPYAASHANIQLFIAS